MKREFLKELGLEQEVIDKIMAEHGTTVEKQKQAAEKYKLEVEGLKTQLSERDTDIENLKASQVDGEALKTQLSELQGKYTTDTETLNKRLSDQEFEFTAKEYLGKYQFTSDLAKNAVMNEFKSKEFKLENGTFLGADDYMKQLKESNPGAFVAEDTQQKVPTVVSGTQGTDPGAKKPSLMELMKMKNANPEMEIKFE